MTTSLTSLRIMELPADGVTPGADSSQVTRKRRGRPRKNSVVSQSNDNGPSTSLSESSTVLDESLIDTHSDSSESEAANTTSVHFKTPLAEREIQFTDEMSDPKENNVYSGDAYELLGFNSIEPSSRPPILPRPPQAEPLLSWAGGAVHVLRCF